MELTIVNGMAMYNLIKEGKLSISGDVEPFNEAMCQGLATEDIFSSEWIDERALALHVMREEYEAIVISPLKLFCEGDYDKLTLYFDEDMFCMINLLTVLAYLDRNSYSGELYLNIIDYDYNVVKEVRIGVSGFHALYVAVVVNRSQIGVKLPSLLARGINLYLEYAQGKSRIDSMIEENINMNTESLLNMIMKKAPEYGLGDVQIMDRINAKLEKL